MPSAMGERPAAVRVLDPTAAQLHPLASDGFAADSPLVSSELDALPRADVPARLEDPFEAVVPPAPVLSAAELLPVASPLPVRLLEAVSLPAVLPVLALVVLPVPLAVLAWLVLPAVLPLAVLVVLPLLLPPASAVSLQSIAGAAVCVPCGCIAGSVMRSTSHVRPLSGVRRFLAVPMPEPVPVAPY